MISASFQKRRLEVPNFNHKNYLKKILLFLLVPFYSLSLLFMLVNLMLKNYIHSSEIKMLFALLFQQSNGNWLPSGVLWFFIHFI